MSRDFQIFKTESGSLYTSNESRQLLKINAEGYHLNKGNYIGIIDAHRVYHQLAGANLRLLVERIQFHYPEITYVTLFSILRDPTKQLLAAPLLLKSIPIRGIEELIKHESFAAAKPGDILVASKNKRIFIGAENKDIDNYYFTTPIKEVCSE